MRFSLSRKNIYHVTSLLFSFAVTGLLLYGISQEINAGAFFELFRQTHFPLFLLYAALSCAALLVRAMRYQILLQLPNSTDEAHFFHILLATTIRGALVDLLPARLGETSFIYVSRRYEMPFHASFFALTASIAFDIVVLALLVLCYLSVLILDYKPEAAMIGESIVSPGIFPHFIIVAFVGVTSFFALRYAATILQFVTSQLQPYTLHTSLADSALIFLNHVATSFATLQNSKAYIKLFLLTLAIRVLKYTSLYVLLSAVILPLGLHWGVLDPGLTTISFICAEFTASLPMSGIMGFGGYELVWSTLFSLSNVKIPSVHSIVLAVHIITQVVGYSFAFAAWGLFLITQRKRCVAKNEKGSMV